MRCKKGKKLKLTKFERHVAFNRKNKKTQKTPTKNTNDKKHQRGGICPLPGSNRIKLSGKEYSYFHSQQSLSVSEAAQLQGEIGPHFRTDPYFETIYDKTK